MAKGKKTGGRQVGSRNKNTLPILEVFEKFQYDPAVEAIKLLMSGKVEPEAALHAHIKLLKFKYRELTSINLQLDDETVDKMKSYEDYIRSLK
jgi:hypothetical protein